MKKVTCNGKLIAENINVADTYFKRLRGLLGKRQMTKDEGLLLTKCASVHCFFMKMTIDVVYLSASMDVLEVETLRPWQIGSWVKGAVHTLELKEGVAQSLIKKGDQLDFYDKA